MYSELFKKDNNSILKYLQKLGANKKIYSECRHGIGPLFPETESYIYATEEEIVIILIDPNKDPISAEKDDMAWDLALTCELFRNRFLRLSKHVPNIYGVLLTSDNVVDYDEMQPVWKTVDIAVTVGSAITLQTKVSIALVEQTVSIEFQREIRVDGGHVQVACAAGHSESQRKSGGGNYILNESFHD